jgi:hypothetical protein
MAHMVDLPTLKNDMAGARLTRHEVSGQGLAQLLTIETSLHNFTDIHQLGMRL